MAACAIAQARTIWLMLSLRENVRRCVGAAKSFDPKSTLADLRLAETTLRDVCRRTRRVFGTSHPETFMCEDDMRKLKAILAKRNSGGA